MRDSTLKVNSNMRRADGWPLCPSCGQDEVWSPLIKKDAQGFPRTPTLAEYELAGGWRCYACGWVEQ